MRIKKYTGPDIKQVTDQMKKELGSEAIILNTRRVSRGGLMGSLGKDVVEITAAIDERTEGEGTTYAAPQRGIRDGSQASLVRSYEKNSGIRKSLQPADREQTLVELRKVADHFDKRKNEDDAAPVTNSPGNADLSSLRADVDEIKTSLRDLGEELRARNIPVLPDRLRDVYAALIQQGVENQAASELIHLLLSNHPTAQQDKREVVDQHVMEAIAGAIRTGTAPKPKSRKSRVVVLVGPTGVGKTTTIAKLAALEKLVNRADVGLITADTFRIAAIEQLRTFAAIADIPMEVVYRPSEMAGALRKFSHKDTIYVDTVGRSQRSKKDMTDLKKFIDAARADEVHLVMSASTSPAVLLDVLEKYKTLNPDHFIFSKVDEAVNFGPLFNIAHHQTTPISYFTTGQSVPDDIVVADGIKFASMVYRGIVPNA